MKLGSGASLRRFQGHTVSLLTDAPQDYAAELLTKLDSFMKQAQVAVGHALGISARPKPVQVIVFETQARYQAYAQKNAPQLVNNGGYYDGGMHAVVTYRFNNSMQLYFHEMVHAIMGEAFADNSFRRYEQHNWPIWFDEGISEYLGSFDVSGKDIKILSINKGKLAYLANAVVNNTFIDLPTLLRARQDRFSGESMNIYYAESWGLLNFLLTSPAHRNQVPKFFRRIHQGEDGLVAFKQSFGQDLSAFDKDWRDHIRQMTKPATGWVPLFNGNSIDDWTVHEGGQWKAGDGEISATSDHSHNYLIKSEIPMANFALELDLQLTRGLTGLVLGNNAHNEYPYNYMIDLAHNAVALRRVHSADNIQSVTQTSAEVPVDKWVHLRVEIIDHVLKLSVDGRKLLTATVEHERFSLFGLYLYKSQARFRNIQVRQEDPT